MRLLKNIDQYSSVKGVHSYVIEEQSVDNYIITPLIDRLKLWNSIATQGCILLTLRSKKVMVFFWMTDNATWMGKTVVGLHTPDFPLAMGVVAQ